MAGEAGSDDALALRPPTPLGPVSEGTQNSTYIAGPGDFPILWQVNHYASVSRGSTEEAAHRALNDLRELLRKHPVLWECPAHNWNIIITTIFPLVEDVLRFFIRNCINSISKEEMLLYSCILAEASWMMPSRMGLKQFSVAREGFERAKARYRQVNEEVPEVASHLMAHNNRSGLFGPTEWAMRRSPYPDSESKLADRIERKHINAWLPLTQVEKPRLIKGWQETVQTMMQYQLCHRFISRLNNPRHSSNDYHNSSLLDDLRQMVKDWGDKENLLRAELSRAVIMNDDKLTYKLIDNYIDIFDNTSSTSDKETAIILRINAYAIRGIRADDKDPVEHLFSLPSSHIKWVIRRNLSVLLPAARDLILVSLERLEAWKREDIRLVLE